VAIVNADVIAEVSNRESSASKLRPPI